jgi:hypothetical protein
MMPAALGYREKACFFRNPHERSASWGNVKDKYHLAVTETSRSKPRGFYWLSEV